MNNIKTIKSTHEDTCPLCKQPFNNEARTAAHQNYQMIKENAEKEAAKKYEKSDDDIKLEKAERDRWEKTIKANAEKEAAKKYEKTPEEIVDEQERIQKIIKATTEKETTDIKKTLQIEQEKNKRLTIKIKSIEHDSDISSELKGSIQHKEISQHLRDHFSDYKIYDYKNGEPGADIMLSKNSQTTSNTLLIESKHKQKSKSFQQNWIKKALLDKKEANADFVLIASTVLPDKIMNTKTPVKNFYIDENKGFAIFQYNSSDPVGFLAMVEYTMKCIELSKAGDISVDEMTAHLEAVYGVIYSTDGKNRRSISIQAQEDLNYKLKLLESNLKSATSNLTSCISLNEQVKSLMMEVDNELVQIENTNINLLTKGEIHE